MKHLPSTDLDQIAKTLAKGQIVGVPTETVYGLAVRADNIPAIKDLLNLKRRHPGTGKVLSLMLPDTKDISNYAIFEGRARNLSQRLFPAELTVVFPKNPKFTHKYFDHFETIGIRIPDHTFMLSLLQKTGALLVTSANPRGEAPCRTSEELASRMPEIPAIVTGRAGGNLPSTVIDFSSPEGPTILRQGGLLLVHY